MSETTTLTIQATTLINPDGVIRYAKTAYKTGDTQTGISILTSMIGEYVTDECIINILEGSYTYTADSSGNVTLIIASSHYKGKTA
jgi:hypothetical protein